MMTRLLLLDDEAHVLSATQRILNKEQWQIDTFTDPHEALSQLAVSDYDVILADYRMHDMDGVSFLEFSKVKQPDAMRIILSGHADLDAVMDAINRAEIYRFIAKPCNPKELKAALKQAIKHRNLLLENKQLADSMREQRSKLSRQQRELVRLEKENPGITQIEFDDEGAIRLSEDECE